MILSKTYACGFNNKVYRLDNNNFPTSWVDVSIPDQAGNKTVLYDIMTSPIDKLKVCVVGLYNRHTDGNTFNQGIIMSFDGGSTWGKPGGNWEIDLNKSTSYSFKEVWFVNDQIIWVVEKSGKIFKSIDGGVTFNSAGSLDYTGLPGTPTSTVNGQNTYQKIDFAAAIHAISDKVAVVGVSRTRNITNKDLYVFKTIDGGITWNVLNTNGGTVINSSGNTLVNPNGYDGSSRAIWISDNETSIIFTSGVGQFVSTDSGNTFNEKLIGFIIGSGSNESIEHMTWFPSYGTPTVFKNVGGKSASLSESNDLGETWQILRAKEQITIRGFHLYNLNEGYYVVNNKVYYTSDGGLTGSDTQCPVSGMKAFNAVWTNYKKYNSDGCGHCPKGYYEDPNNPDNCIKEVYSPALNTGETVIAKPGYNYPSYGWAGGILYEDVTNKTFPLDSDSIVNNGTVYYTQVSDANNNLISVDQVFNNSGEPWRVPVATYGILPLENLNCPDNQGREYQDTGEGRLVRSGILGWDPSTECYKYHTWYGFEKCIDVNKTTTYILGLAANNFIKVYVNDVLIYYQTDGNHPYFCAWRLLPITLNQGVNKIKMLGKDESPGGSVGFEIYDLDNSQSGNPRSIRDIQTTEELENSLIFSTKDLLDKELFIFENYKCLGSDVLDFCKEPICLKYENINKIRCSCYKITNCENEEDWQLVTVAEGVTLNKNSIYIFEFDLDKCWKVELSNLCSHKDGSGILDIPIVIPFQENKTCDECLKDCYNLISCNDSCPDIKGVMLPRQKYSKTQLYITNEKGCKFYIEPYNRYLGYYAIPSFNTIKDEINNNNEFVVNINSLFYNGIEYITNPYQVIITNQNINPLLCNGLDCVISNINSGNTINNITNLLNSIFETFNLDLVAHSSSNDISCNSIIFNDEKDAIAIEFTGGNTFDIEMNYVYDSSTTTLSVKNENLPYQTKNNSDIATCLRKKQCKITNLTLTPINEECEIKKCNLTYRKPNPNDNLKNC